ncbi:Putative epoxide hydrolase [Frankia alni ACN14a]|uniref:Epoxide hydrolase n=1 Tax=Frankia alni (strain DSM 45986 / CECT 9034 / ACN14a) TaxID=326424 RepID=Q0RMK9_FRAAA|nr:MULTISPECIES: epoxide hydrolase [Frankia]CAJ61241.1 Putative epoxide hydrolase [Frankia alni ACN14a]
MTHPVVPSPIAVPEADLQDLHLRLDRTRWPAPETVTDTSQGPQLARIKSLVKYWCTSYDWRLAEQLLNSYNHSTTQIDGLDIAFLHIRSPHADATPLLMTHGWPGSVLEFRHVIAPLTHPQDHGGAVSDAFHLVIPSLPGFGFSQPPTEPGWDFKRTARAWSTLMERHGYHHWYAQGGNLGAAVTEEIAALQPAGLEGIHLNFATFPRRPLRRLGGTRPLHGGSTQSRQPHARAAMRVYAPGRLSVMSPSRSSPNPVGLQTPIWAVTCASICRAVPMSGGPDGYGVVVYTLTRDALGLMLLRVTSELVPRDPSPLTSPVRQCRRTPRLAEAGARPSSPCGPPQRPSHRLTVPRQCRGAAAEVARPPERLRVVARQHSRLGAGWFCPGSGPWASRGRGLSALGGCPVATLAG